MAKFVFAYTGGGMAETPEAQQKAMDEWTAWFAELGPDIVDGGNPFGISATVTADGVAENGASALTGYTIITAEDITAASEKAKGCPALASGGTVEVYEALPMD